MMDDIPIAEVRPCDWPECPCEGLYRAPRSRSELASYLWFCLEHVRQYNLTWNYYQGMSEAEVEADLRFDTVWQRPSWRMGAKVCSKSCSSMSIEDVFGLFDDPGLANGQNRTSDRHSRANPTETAEERALACLDLRPPVTVAIVKARYKALVKLHHPDANGGDQASEERFKLISEAYRTVMACLAP